MPTTLEPLSLLARDTAAAIIEARDKGKIGESFEAEITTENTVDTAGTSALTGLNRAAVEELHNKGHIRISAAGNKRFTVRLTPMLSAAPPPAPDLAAMARKWRV
jgi:hypothetical protein